MMSNKSEDLLKTQLFEIILKLSTKCNFIELKQFLEDKIFNKMFILPKKEFIQNNKNNKNSKISFEKLLKSWNLETYIKNFQEGKCTNINKFNMLDSIFLKNKLHMKTGHVKRFIKKRDAWFNKIKNNKNINYFLFLNLFQLVTF